MMYVSIIYILISETSQITENIYIYYYIYIFSHINLCYWQYFIYPAQLVDKQERMNEGDYRV